MTSLPISTWALVQKPQAAASFPFPAETLSSITGLLSHYVG
jgi:hypothetical protein